MNALRRKGESAAFALLVGLASVLPRRALLAIGSAAGAAGYLLDARHRAVALENVRAAYGDALDARERRRIVRRAWGHFGRITLDALTFPRWSAADVGGTVTVAGLENLREAHRRGRGVVCFTAHFGHWELAGLVQGFLGFPLALIARPLDNPDLERRLAALRELSGNRVVHKRQALREMLRAIGRGLAVAILIDQDAREQGVFVPFLGRPASTTPSLALVALRTGAAVVPVYCVPERGGRYRIVYEAEVPVEPTGDRDADVLRLTRRCTERVEAWVRERPECWLWMHRRWKTRPAEER